MSGEQVRELLRAAAQVSAQLSISLQDSPLTVDRWRVLCLVADRRDAAPAMSEIAEALVLPPATTTRAVDALVEIGAVYREVAVGDRRRVVLRISRTGRELLAALEPAVDAIAPTGTGALLG